MVTKSLNECLDKYLNLTEAIGPNRNHWEGTQKIESINVSFVDLNKQLTKEQIEKAFRETFKKELKDEFLDSECAIEVEVNIDPDDEDNNLCEVTMENVAEINVKCTYYPQTQWEPEEFDADGYWEKDDIEDFIRQIVNALGNTDVIDIDIATSSKNISYDEYEQDWWDGYDDYHADDYDRWRDESFDEDLQESKPSTEDNFDNEKMFDKFAEYCDDKIQNEAEELTYTNADGDEVSNPVVLVGQDENGNDYKLVEDIDYGDFSYIDVDTGLEESSLYFLEVINKIAQMNFDYISKDFYDEITDNWEDYVDIFFKQRNKLQESEEMVSYTPTEEEE